jgi:hypothetical protein
MRKGPTLHIDIPTLPEFKVLAAIKGRCLPGRCSQLASSGAIWQDKTETAA